MKTRRVPPKLAIRKTNRASVTTGGLMFIWYNLYTYLFMVSQHKDCYISGTTLANKTPAHLPNLIVRALVHNCSSTHHRSFPCDLS